jgi:ATP adenylyltransferase/5',5'''-P-1,P-4-tetraphosphate phosphorylase II
MSRKTSVGKRRVEDKRKQHRQAKAERKDERNQDAGQDTTDHAGLMERFRVVNEQHQQGLLSDEEFRTERDDILLALGIEPPEGP